MSTHAAPIRTLLTPPKWLAAVGDYWVLTKPEVNFLVLVSTLVGFDLAARGPLDLWRLFHTLVGTLLVASGTGTLNHYMERRSDAFMHRTARRPLPAGRLTPAEALVFGVVISALGGAYLFLAVNALTSILALATLGTYLLIYTPLKARTPWCTFIGAFPGAMPPLIGWAAARGHLSLEGWVLYAILFFWQFPHFLAIAWMYREDYSRAGLQMLPRRDPDGRAMGRQVLAFSLALLPVSLIPAAMGAAGLTYLICAGALGVGIVYFSLRLATERSTCLAKQLLLASVVYLPLVFGLLMLDKKPL